MGSIIQESFSINLRLMSLLRMYPPDKPTFFFRLQAITLFVLLIPPVPIFGSLFFIFENDFTTAQVNDNAFLIAEMACQITKFFPFIVNGGRIKRCIHHFESLHLTLNKKQRHILEQCCAACRRNTKIFLYTICAAIVFFAIRPVFIKSQRLPGEIWLPYNLVENPIFYPIVYTFVVLGVGYTSLACAAIDPLIGGLAYLGTGQLRVLKDYLQHLDEYTEENIKYENANRNKIMHQLIKQCVEHHNSILNFASEFEKCLSPSVFSQFMGSILVICFCCLQLSKLEPLSFNFISMVMFFSVVLAQIYVYCYYGTVFFDESDSLIKAIYMGHWYEYDTNIQKSLLVLMERSKKPVIITAGTILEISIETFAKILKRSYSLLAVLQNM